MESEAASVLIVRIARRAAAVAVPVLGASLGRITQASSKVRQMLLASVTCVTRFLVCGSRKARATAGFAVQALAAAAVGEAAFHTDDFVARLSSIWDLVEATVRAAGL